MRIISGKYGGRKIKLPKGLPMRPTMDRSREALASMLVHRTDLATARIADIFAGSGSVGLELLSRGAAEVIFVEQHPRIYAYLQQTLRELGDSRARVLRKSAYAFLALSKLPFDLVFMDPPYDFPEKSRLIRTALEAGNLNRGGMVVLEHDKREEFSFVKGFTEARTYGTSCFSFFKNGEE